MKLTKLISSLFSFLAIAVAFVFVARPALHDGLFHVYDNVHVTRLMAFSTELASGQFPVRYLNSFGHGAGYFLFQFYSPLIYYLGSFIHMLGFSYIQSIKLVYLIFLTTGTIGIYVLLRSLVGRFATVIGTITFLLSPYLYHVFFHRGTITEAAAMMLIPWVIWAFAKLKNDGSKVNIVLGAVLVALSILTHTLTAIMTILAIIAYHALPPFSIRNLIRLVASITLAIGLSAFFLIPSIIDSKLVQYTNNSLVERGYLDHPVAFTHQAFALGDGTEKSAYIGLTLLVGFLFTLALSSFSRRFRQNHSSILISSLIIVILGFFIMSPASSFIWANIIYLRYIQFPFRFLTVVTVFATILYSLLLEHFSHSRFIQITLTILIFLPLLISSQFHQPLGFQYTTDYRVEDPCMTASWADEHLPIWVKECLLKPRENLVESLSFDLVVNQVAVEDNGRSMTIHTAGDGDMLISKYYFPSWVAINADHQNLPPSPYGIHGLIKLSIESSDSPVSVSLQPTRLEIFSSWLTIFSLLISGLLIYSAYAKRK